MDAQRNYMTGPSETVAKSTISSQLQNMFEILIACESSCESIQNKLSGGRVEDVNKAPPPNISNVSSLVMEIQSKVQRVRDALKAFDETIG